MNPDGLTAGIKPLLAAEVPTMTEMMQIIMDRLAQHEEAHKAANERLTALTAVIMPPAGDVSGPTAIRRQLFATTNSTTGSIEQTIGSINPTTGGVEQTAGGLESITSRQFADLCSRCKTPTQKSTT